LKSIPALNAIIKAGEISSSDVVLEIGPGRGALTSKLLGAKCKVLAIEKDKELYELLKMKFKKEIRERQLDLIHKDILDFNPKTYNLDTRTYKIIANIPYNITGAILKKFLTEENQPEKMILMVQNEVAKRIVSKKESILSISVKAYGEPKIVMKVPARYFSPAPKVDSAIIAINNISRKIFKESDVDEERFWEIVKNGFAHKRKKLSGNLKNIISPEKLLKSGFKDKRAEELSLSDWILLTKN
jgi:16S rRNA (adenine1518-N6/adenine1519-N6)-dimethyltransferase